MKAGLAADWTVPYWILVDLSSCQHCGFVYRPNMNSIESPTNQGTAPKKWLFHNNSLSLIRVLGYSFEPELPGYQLCVIHCQTIRYEEQACVFTERKSMRTCLRSERRLLIKSWSTLTRPVGGERDAHCLPGCLSDDWKEEEEDHQKRRSVNLEWKRSFKWKSNMFSEIFYFLFII